MKLLTLLVAFMATVDYGSTMCPDGCKCFGYSVQYIDCYKAGLTDIPSDLPPNTYSLEANFNSIYALKKETFSYIGASSHLTRVELQGNKISTIEPEALSNLTSLSSLYLGSNMISTLDPGVFKGLHGLVWLDLENNRIGSLSEDVFEDLESLQWLDLDSNRIGSVHQHTFRNLTKLTRLFLSHNKIHTLYSEMFLGLHNLITLHFTDNRLKSLDPNTFVGLERLSALSISDNRLEDLKLDTFAGLVNLTALNINNNRLRTLKADIFRHLRNLTSLSLMNNSIDTIEVGAWRGLANLEGLSLEENKLTRVEPRLFSYLLNLTALHLGNNRLSNIEPDTFSNLPKLGEMSLAGNRLRCIHPNSFANTPKLTKLLLDRNPHIVLPTSEPFFNSPSLEAISMSLCNIERLPVTLFQNTGNVESITVHSNHIKTIDTQLLKTVPRLNHIDIFDNPLSCDCRLKATLDWCNQHRVSSSGACHTPSRLNGTIWNNAWSFGDCQVEPVEEDDWSGPEVSCLDASKYVDDDPTTTTKRPERTTTMTVGLEAAEATGATTHASEKHTDARETQSSCSSVFYILILQCVILCVLTALVAYVMFFRYRLAKPSGCYRESVENLPLCDNA